MKQPTFPAWLNRTVLPALSISPELYVHLGQSDYFTILMHFLITFQKPLSEDGTNKPFVMNLFSQKSNNTTVSEMWSNFNVDAYAPRQRPKPRARPAKKFTPVQKPTVTVPDPFYMTLRDELKVFVTMRHFFILISSSNSHK